jgi:hypothetical protein
MDCVTMVLVERETGLPLDLVVLINNFLHERISNRQSRGWWLENEAVSN